MTALEISEIFSLWALNWPSAELFKGGVEMLDLRCKLYAEQLSDVDYWDGLHGAALSLKTRKYAPNIAEFAEDIQTAKEKVKSEIDHAYIEARSAIHLAEYSGETAEQAIRRLPQRTQTVIRVMGGLEAFMPPDKGFFDMSGFIRTYETLLRKRNMLTGEKYEPLPAGKAALPGRERKSNE